jgi:hypothetical protein
MVTTNNETSQTNCYLSFGAIANFCHGFESFLEFLCTVTS